MSDLTAVVVLVSLTVVTYTLLYLGLRQVHRPTMRVDTPAAEDQPLADQPSGPPTVPGEPPTFTYAEVGTWSGGSRPRGAVVVGYDDKKHSGSAVRWAAREAARRGAPLVVLHAADFPGMVGEPGPGLHHRDPDALVAAEEVTARGVAEAVAARPGLSVVGATEVTAPARALVDASEDAVLVVVGSRGFGRFLGVLGGSVAFDTAGRALAPVTVVTWNGADRHEGPGRPVVVGTDGSPAADRAVRQAADRAATASAPLDIITSTGTIGAVAGAGAGRYREVDAVAHRIVLAAAERSRATHPRLTVRTHVDRRPAPQALLAAARDAGLVVVGTRGRGAVAGMLLGSVSHAIIHAASSPVLVVGDGTSGTAASTAAADHRDQVSILA